MSNPATGELAGRVILVTGASRGIGHAVVAACAAAGAEVLACGRDVAALEKLADGIEADGDPAPMLVPVNLETATYDDYQTIGDHIADRYGRLDGFVANAATLGELAPLVSYDAMTWARVFQVNVHSVFLLLQRCLPLLARAAAPSVVFTLAEEGLEARAHWGAYAVSKYALHGLMDLLAAEWRPYPHRRANGVVPGVVDTRLRRTAYPALGPSPLVSPAAVADTFVALLGPRGTGLSGQVVRAAHGKFEP